MTRRTFAFWRSFLVTAWLLFNVSLAGWWFIFGLHQVNRLAALQHEAAAEFVRYQRMLHWEGAALILSLFAGAMALLYLVRRELKQREAINSFFATFTHELKTPIASLQLQAESLKEEVEKGALEPRLLERLIADAGRLNLQLQNCLFLANVKERDLLFQEFRLSSALESIEGQWPQLRLERTGDCVLTADRRSLESVLQNLIQNSAVHGRASEVKIAVSQLDAGHVRVTLRDNGSGFRGDRTALTNLFKRHYAGSGSGIGLYLVKKLIAANKGRLELPDVTGTGFETRLILKGKALG